LERNAALQTDKGCAEIFDVEAAGFWMIGRIGAKVVRSHRRYRQRLRRSERLKREVERVAADIGHCASACKLFANERAARHPSAAPAADFDVIHLAELALLNHL